jgi:hypothetical protein
MYKLKKRLLLKLWFLALLILMSFSAVCKDSYAYCHNGVCQTWAEAMDIEEIWLNLWQASSLCQHIYIKEFPATEMSYATIKVCGDQVWSEINGCFAVPEYVLSSISYLNYCLDPNNPCCASTNACCGSTDSCCGDPNCDNSCGNNSGSSMNWNLGTAGNP